MSRGSNQEKEVADPAEIGAHFSCKIKVFSLPETGRACRVTETKGLGKYRCASAPGRGPGKVG